MRSEEANKQIVLDYVDAFNRGDEEALKTLFAPEALAGGRLSESRGT